MAGSKGKKADKAPRVSDEHYRSLFTNVPIMLHSIAEDGRLLAVNQRWLEVLGYAEEEVLGRKSIEFLTEESREAAAGYLPKFWKDGTAYDVPYQFVKKNGEIVDVLLSGVVERDADGTITHQFAALIEITERKRLEGELQQAREELEGRVERQLVRGNPYELTFREFTVLHHVADGDADKEIAAKLGISPLTVHKHVSHLLAKMDASSRPKPAPVLCVKGFSLRSQPFLMAGN